MKKCVSAWARQAAFLCFSGFAAALLGACGGGNASSTAEFVEMGEPTPPPGAELPPLLGADLPPLMGTALPPPVTTGVYCDGSMMQGSARWCLTGDGSVKDMTTNTVWLRDAGCAGLQSWNQAAQWTLALTSGQCALSDGSKSGDWVLPSVAALQALTQGIEPVSTSTPRLFSNIAPVYPYWSSESYGLGSLGNVARYVYLMTGNLLGFASWTTLNYARSVLPTRRTADNRSTTLDGSKGYALAPLSASYAIPGTSNGLAHRFVTQQGYNCCGAAGVVLGYWEDFAGKSYRTWYFDADNTGYFRIHSQPWYELGWGRWGYLAVKDASAAAGAHVIAWPGAGGDNHLWFPVINADSSWSFKNKLSGLCMQWQSNQNDESLEQHPCVAGSSNQSFIVFPR